MSTITPEALQFQILSTCLLISTQGKWHAFYYLSSHVGSVEVRLKPSDHDYTSKTHVSHPNKSATFTSTNRHPWPCITEDDARKALTELLVWTQSFLDVEAAA